MFPSQRWTVFKQDSNHYTSLPVNRSALMFSKPAILAFKQIALISLSPFRSERLIKLIYSWLMQVGSLWLPPITFRWCGTTTIYLAFKKYICKNDLGNCGVRLKYIIKSLVNQTSSIFCVAIWKRRCYRTGQHLLGMRRDPVSNIYTCTSLIAAQLFYYCGSKEMLSYEEATW